MKAKFLSVMLLAGMFFVGTFFTGCQNVVIVVDTDELNSSQSLSEYKGFGFKLKAFNGDKKAKLSVVKANSVVKGFGVKNSTPSNELGNNSSILVSFALPVSDANVTFSWLGGSEKAKVEIIANDKKTILKSFIFKNGSDRADTYTNLSLEKSPNFKYMRFSAVGNGSDFLVNQIKAVVSLEKPNPNLVLEGTSNIKLNPDKPKPVDPAPVDPSPVDPTPVDPNPVTPSNINKNLLLQLVNNARARGANCGGVWHNPVGPVKWNNKLELAAKRHSDDMNRHKHFSHTGTDGSKLADRIDGVGYSWRMIGENIAAGQPNERVVINSWLKSPGHCKNIMNGNFKDMGVYKTGKYWTQDFGTGWD